jgi:predicted PurR-regulated permease PerM
LKRASASSEQSRLLGVVAAVVVVAALYFARIVFVPLALASLFALLLTPAVSFLERIKLPRILAVFLAIAAPMALLGLMVWQTSHQLVDLTGQLPAYKQTLVNKIQSLKGGKGRSLDKASDAVKELASEISDATPGATAATGSRKTAPPVAGSSPSRPLSVEVVPPANPLESAENILGPLGTAGIIVIFTVFILVGREDLRNRLIRLAGGARLNVMTQALDEATQRINRYLILQLAVNSGFGLLIFTGLHFIGVPNASLWGVVAAVLRFLPYVGTPIAALMPIVLSLAVFEGWQHAIATVALFAGLEIVIANFVEPLLYGSHLGLAPLAILVAAIFWTLIWGFPGLVLSTPLTVCLVVIGRYVPRLSFLNVLFGDEPVLPLEAQYYQRLLATDQNEARQVLEQFLKDKSLEELYSSVLIPALSLAEQDRHRNELDEETQNFIYQSTREIVEELEENSAAETTQTLPEGSSGASAVAAEADARLGVVCIPARDDADDVVGMLLARLLARQGQIAQSISIGPTAEMLAQVKEIQPDVVCISALPPFAINHARALYSKLRALSPTMHIVICLWNFEGDIQKTATRLNLSKSHGFFTTLPQILQHIAFRAEEFAQLSR